MSGTEGNDVEELLNYNSNSTEEDENEEVDSTKQLARFLFYYVPALIFLGSVGNVLLALAFLTTKLRKITSCLYITALCVSDTLILLEAGVQWLSHININIYDEDYFCQSLSFLSQSAHFTSIWLVVAFIVERFIALAYPLKRQSMCTVRRAWYVIIGLVILGSITGIPFIFIFAPRETPLVDGRICIMLNLEQVCSNAFQIELEQSNDHLQFKSSLKIFYSIDTAITDILPIMAITTLNSFIIYSTVRTARIRYVERIDASFRRRPTGKSETTSKLELSCVAEGLARFPQVSNLGSVQLLRSRYSTFT